MLLGLILFLSVIALPITPNTLISVSLDGESPAYYKFSGVAGQAVTIDFMQADDDVPLNNPVLGLIADGRLLAFNNDAHPNTKDAQIRSYVLPVTGEYWIYADTYGGIYAGDLTLTLTFVDSIISHSSQNQSSTMVNVLMPARQVYRYQMDFQAGDTVTLTAQSRTTGQDLVLWLYDEAGNLLAYNDDHGIIDDTLNDLDAQIRDFVIPSDGTFEIVVSDLLDTAGEFMLMIHPKD
jgi:hypothetical protein